MKYVLFYVVNGLGMGHLTRSLAIARQLRKLSNQRRGKDKEVVPLFFTASEGASVLYDEGFAYYKVPSKTSAQKNRLLRRHLAFSYTSTVLSLVNTYQPAGLVVDTFPLGSLNDLTSVLSLPLKWKKFFIHREQKQMLPERVNTQLLYDWVIAPHQKDKAHIPIPEKTKLFWSNEILIKEPSELLGREQIRQKLGIKPEQKLLLINLGGGGDQTTPLNYQHIFEQLPSDYRLLIPKPPLSRNLDFIPKNALFLSHYPLMEWMPAIDFAISAGGYNTFHELLSCQIPSIFVPKERGYDDQLERIQRAVKGKAGLMLAEDKLQKDLRASLAELEERKAELVPNAKSFVLGNGAKRAAQLIWDEIQSQSYPKK